MEPVFRYERHDPEVTRYLGGNIQFLSNQSLNKNTGQEIIALNLDMNGIPQKVMW